MSTNSVFHILLICFINIVCSFTGDDEPVTFGSVIKIKHSTTGYFLHSHDVKWGSGSGQQSVTGFKDNTDSNSLWQLNKCQGCPDKPVGTPLKCGSKVRISHQRTGKNLHSHTGVAAPISNRQEVSGFGTDGKGDTGDNWKVVCMNKKAKYWIREDEVSFKHIESSGWLYTNGQTDFNRRNCGGNCPIANQLEISVGKKRKKGSLWKAEAGVHFKVRDDYDLEVGAYDKEEL